MEHKNAARWAGLLGAANPRLSIRWQAKAAPPKPSKMPVWKYASWCFLYTVFVAICRGCFYLWSANKRRTLNYLVNKRLELIT